MKKIYFFSCLKVVLIIALLNANTSLFATTNIKFNLEFNKQYEKAQCNLSNNTAYIKGDSRLEIPVLPFYNLKKPINIHHFGLNQALNPNEKTKKLHFYWVYPVTPSLNSTELIYPFHSFF